MDNHTVERTLDLTSIGVAIGALVGWLPAIAALLTIIWTGIRIWETDTVQKWVKREPRDGE